MMELSIQGNPTPEQAAAIVAVVTSLSASVAPTPERTLDLWAAKGRMTRPSVRPGPGAWRASFMPR